MKLNEQYKVLSKKTWNTARKNGFGVVCPRKLRLMATTELAEAVQEYSKGRIEIYTTGNGKPEGFLIELADTTMRLLTFFGGLGYDSNLEVMMHYLNYDTNELRSTQAIITKPIEDFLDYQLNLIIKGTHEYETSPFKTQRKLVEVVNNMHHFMQAQYSTDLVEVILLKDRYNKTRPYRHGGKNI